MLADQVGGIVFKKSMRKMAEQISLELKLVDYILDEAGFSEEKDDFVYPVVDIKLMKPLATKKQAVTAVEKNDSKLSRQSRATMTKKKPKIKNYANVEPPEFAEAMLTLKARMKEF